MQIDNIKIIADILKDGGLEAVKNEFSDNEKRVKEFKAVLEKKLAELAEKAAEEARVAAELAAREESKKAAKAEKPERAETPADGDAEKAAKQPISEEKPAEIECACFTCARYDKNHL